MSTYTYDDAALDATPLFQVRFLLGDKGPDEWTFSDEEIQFIVSRLGSPCRTAVLLADRKAAELAATDGAISLGDASVSGGMNAQAWSRFADALRTYCASLGSGLTGIGIGPCGVPYSALPHVFELGMHDSGDTGGGFGLGPNSDLVNERHR